MGDEMVVDMLGSALPQAPEVPQVDTLADADRKALQIGRAIQEVAEKLAEVESSREGIRSVDDEGLSKLVDTHTRGVEWLERGPGAVDAQEPSRLVADHFGRMIADHRDREAKLRRQILTFERAVADLHNQASAEWGKERLLNGALSGARPGLEAAKRRAAESPEAAEQLAEVIARAERHVADVTEALPAIRQRAQQAEAQKREAEQALVLMREELGVVRLRLRTLGVELEAELSKHFEPQQKLLELQRLVRVGLDKLGREIERRRKKLADRGKVSPV